MKIDIRAISRDIGALIKVDISLDPKQIGLEYDGFVFSEYVNFEGFIKSVAKGVMQLSGEVSTVIGANCDRCLRDTQIEISDELNVIFRTVNMQSGNLDIKTDDATEYYDEDEYTYRGYDLIPDKAVRDAVLLALPGKILCKDNCMRA